MLSIMAMTAGKENYYLHLAREDYYTEGGERPGEWYAGAAAEQLGLEGQVEGAALRALMQGLGPDGKPFVQLQKNHPHQPGWDLCFSAPKSVSVLWAMAPASEREAIQLAHREAVAAALEYMEKNVIVTRRGQGGQICEPASMLAAMFEHGTSRNQDPQLHTHVLLANVVVRQDGTTGTLDSLPIYERQLEIGAIYRAELAWRLRQDVGLSIRPDGEFFRIPDVPEDLCEHFSSRSQEIRHYMDEMKLPRTPKAAEKAALATRGVKGHVARRDLFTRWHNIGEEHRFGVDQAADLIRAQRQTNAQRRLGADEDAQAARIVRHAADTLGKQQGEFSQSDLVQSAAIAGQHRGLKPEAVLNRIARDREQKRTFERKEEGSGEDRYTTKSARRLFGELEDAAARLAQNKRFRLTEDYVRRRLGKYPELSDEQRQAIVDISTKPGAFQCVDGVSGSGKTSMLKAANDLWRDAGYTVVGCATTRTAARKLEAASGIESATVAGVLYHEDPTLRQQLVHHARQLGRAALGKPTYALKDAPLTRDTVLVVDNANMVGNSDLTRLLRRAEKARAKVILIGDRRQIEAYKQAGAFSHLIEKFGAADLHEIHRQQEPWQQEVVRQLAKGDVRGALTQFMLAGDLCPENNRERAMRSLITRWQLDRASDKELPGYLIIGRSQEDARELNIMAQQSRRQMGQLKPLLRQHIADGWVYRDDRVCFTRGNRARNYRSGEFGTVEKIGLDESLTIRLDRKERMGLFHRHVRVKLSASQYKDLQLGYAVTASQAQGLDVERAYAFLEPYSLEPTSKYDRRLTYAQLCTAKDKTQVFVAGADIADELEVLEETARLSQETLHEARRQRERQEEAMHEAERQRQAEQQAQQQAAQARYTP